MLRLIAFGSVVAGIVVSAASAKTDTPPANLVQTRQAFAAAVSSNNPKRAAELTSFPLKNEVYKAPPTVSRAGFAKLFASYREMEACIRTQPLEPQGAGWIINCDGNILHFGVQGGRWMHTKYENINE